MSREATEPVVSATRRFFAWLSRDSLPLWSSLGVDRDSGGFIEQLTPVGKQIADVRRARLVARQIYAFKTAGDLGWTGPADGLVRHGLDALLQRHVAGSEVIPRYLPAENRGAEYFDLYDQAFVLFGLAHAFAHSQEEELEAQALSIIQNMREQWRHPGGGFVEHALPLKSNPHMHLLEASLAWLHLSQADAWRETAAEIVNLCLTRFVDTRVGALHEYFGTEWEIVTGTDDVVEPGHQAEWAWLLLRWENIEPAAELRQAATRLLTIAERQGENIRQRRLVNELHSDLSVRDGRCRLWPQTERIKALIAFHRIETDALRRRQLLERLQQSVDALLAYFDHPMSGSWWEHFDEHGVAVDEPARASSLYHIMGAAAELADFTGLRLD